MTQTPVLWPLVLAAAAVVALAVFWARAWRVRRAREDDENALKHLFHQRGLGQAPSFASLTGVLHRRNRSLAGTLERLERDGLIETRGQTFALTEAGEKRARQIVRAHRLWERYLADEAGMPLHDLHAAADAREHRLTADEVERLDAMLGHPLTDPHGDPIPDAQGDVTTGEEVALTAWPAGVPARIAHLEDEPPNVYRQIEAAGLDVGRLIVVDEATPGAVRVIVDGTTGSISPLAAGNVFVVATDARAADTAGTQPLSQLATGATAEVVALAPACRGDTRRRLLDLGFTPGTRLTAALDTFAGDPRAYRVRGTLIALRREQAAQVLVRDPSREKR